MEQIFSGRVLVVAPHCDDEVIGCGGTILRFRKDFSRLAIVYVAPGEAERQQEAAIVAATLAADATYFLPGVDGFCDSVAPDCVRQLTTLVQEEKPNIVIAPHASDNHPDHRATWRIVIDAVNYARFYVPMEGRTPHRTTSILAYEVWSPIQSPAVICDVTAVFEDKCDLLAKYRSQVSQFPYVDYTRAFNAWRGLLFQRNGYAEVFELHAI
jgi:LmbE family N-acetylglucosaminyl deacetylase